MEERNSTVALSELTIGSGQSVVGKYFKEGTHVGDNRMSALPSSHPHPGQCLFQVHGHQTRRKTQDGKRPHAAADPRTDQTKQKMYPVDHRRSPFDRSAPPDRPAPVDLLHR
ncbi:hypothetical protein DESC_790028 [Desulfosarcina cetonica]|nr:hypothetical protein DESC_790028 [Desulfosarcina cetonica]